MVDVLLIIPKYVMSNITTVKKERGDETLNNIQFDPPLHVTYLAACLEKENLSVKLIDEGVLSLKHKNYDIIDYVKKENPLVIGVHVNSFSLHRVYNLIRSLKDNLKSIIVIGGPHVNFDNNSVIYLDADYGFKGECELTFTSFVKNLKVKQNINDIPGLIRKSGNNIIVNNNTLIENLDDLPFPARDLTPIDDYYNPVLRGKVASIMASRGCVYNCIFCSSPSKRIRFRSPENVVAEIELLARECFEVVTFQDDFLTYNREWIKRICELIIERKISIKWNTATRADFVDNELLSLMKKSGCTLIGCGVESGSDRIRNNVLWKGITNEKLLKGFKMIRDAGIKSAAYVMFGHPTETLKDMNETIKFILKLDPDYADFNLSTIIPGTRIFDVALKEGKINLNEWKDVSEDKKYVPVYIPDGISLEQMQEIQKKAFFRFYYRPKVLWREIGSINSFADFTFKAKKALQLFSYFSTA